jgi:glycosyltransferase involved in cell wall biosynthesis
MRLSLVIPYYNRRGLLFNVLKSISTDYAIETIIVDDGSTKEHQIYDLPGHFPKLNIKILRLEKTGWRGPCIAYNEGFRLATGDVILINSSECIHVGDVLGCVYKNFQPDSYMAFSTFAGTEPMNRLISTEDPRKLINGGRWLSSLKNYTLIPYCAVISKANMDLLGGYDERFTEGIGFDDYEFIDRVKNLGLKTELIENPFVFHQWHKPTDINNGDPNMVLWQKLRRMEPNRIKAYVKER